MGGGRALGFVSNNHRLYNSIHAVITVRSSTGNRKPYHIVSFNLNTSLLVIYKLNNKNVHSITLSMVITYLTNAF